MDSFTDAFSRETILQLIDSRELTVWFQPIFSGRTGKIYGYEALTRLTKTPPQGCDISQLFDKAHELGIISSLDMLCRENAFRRAKELGFGQQESRLYVNICPASLMHPDYKAGMTDQFAERHGIVKERVILEITEQESIRNYELFKRSIDHYRQQGYKIAIDDFGVGYGGLKMLSIIEPDYVKIDRHFIAGIDSDSFKYNLVDALATVCHKLGIIVIAEGIERAQELEAISRFGIELLQGFLLEKPGPALSERRIDLPARQHEALPWLETELFDCAIGAIAKHVEPLAPGQPLLTAHQRFMADQGLQAIPIVDRDYLVGMLCRRLFLEQQLVGPYGFGYALSTHRTIGEALEPGFLAVEVTTAIEEVVLKIQTRRRADLGDDLGITRNGKYQGVVAINDLLAAITQKSLQLAKGANPLTGLPGNAFIQGTLTRLIAQKVCFAACYIDIDDFKPYNDNYGFEKGDTVIKTLGELIVESVGGNNNDGLIFVGHIGGDDFIAVTRTHLARTICERIIAEFEEHLILFHGPGDYARGYYSARDRQGTERRMPLMALSIGIVTTDDCEVDSYGELAALVSEVKRAAKGQRGSAIVHNRRGMVKTESAAFGNAA